MELAAIWRGKLIGSYMIKIRFEKAVQAKANSAFHPSRVGK